jgi:hypothetical protein
MGFVSDSGIIASGSTSGDIYWCEPLGGTFLKVVYVACQSYNDSGTYINFTIPMAFNPPALIANTTGLPDSSVSLDSNGFRINTLGTSVGGFVLIAGA